MRLGGVSQVYLDTPEDFAFRLSKDAEKLSRLNKITVEGALRVTINETRTNNAVLVEFLTPNTTDRRTKWIDVLVEVQGVATNFTRMYVVGRRLETREWEIEFALPDDHWIEAASNKKINTIDFGGFTLTKANVLTAWNYPTYDGDFTPTQDGAGWNGAYGWWPVNFGNWVDQTLPSQNTIKPVKMMAVEDLRPHTNFIYLLKRGFCEVGWTLGGLITEHPWALSLWAYLLKESYYIGKGYDGIQYGKYCRIVGRIRTAPVAITTLSPSNPFIYFDTLDYVGASGSELILQGGPNKWMCGIQNPLPFAAQFKCSFKFVISYIQIIGAVPYDIVFRMAEIPAGNANNDTWTGEILSDDAAFVLNPAEDKFVAFDFEITLQPGQKAALQFGGGFAAYINPGFWFNCEPNNKAFTREDEVDLRTALDESLTLLDLFKSFVHLVNGRIETDYRSRTVTVHPERTSQIYGEQVQGFIRDDLEAIDINADVLPASVRIAYIRPDLKKYTLLGFADTNDPGVEDLELTEPLHSRKILNGDDLPDETEEILNPVFEPTREAQSDLLKQNEFTIVNRPDAPTPYLPAYLDNQDGERSFDIGPRILFAFGNVRQINPAPLATTDLYANFFFDEYASATEAFGYATQLRTWNVSPTPTLDGSVVFGRTAHDLFVNFYIGLTNDNRGGANIEVLQRMTMAQYADYNFRRLFTFQVDGRRLQVPMVQIRDFQPPLPTPVVFFASPVETGCCDLPCSCRFQTCEYYQDLGEYIAQSTLDTLAVTSVKIDNKEILTADVPLGALNIIDLGGGPYVTNLVDALNSIGAPYFVFEYSTRQHATKGSRFFKIKWPYCQGFEIIISESGSPVYRYTQDEQQEQWFAGSWGALGYGGETYTAPDNCEITIEY